MMKKRSTLIISYFLFVCSLFLPWFTYNPKLMGYCWGFQFFYLWLIPITIIGAFVFAKGKKAMFILSELSLATMFGIYIFAIGRWQELRNIISGFHWKDGLHTATVGYWVSLCLFCVLAILLQFHMNFVQEHSVFKSK